MGAPLNEEPLDQYLNRPVAKPIARLLLRTPVTPNHVSMAVAALGVVAGVALGWGPRWAAVAAAGLGWAAMVLDCVDGLLARARGGGSKYGYLIDGVADSVVATATHLGFISAALATPVGAAAGAIGVVPVVVLCGVFMAMHSTTYESVKFRYRMTLGDEPGAHLAVQQRVLESLENDTGFFKAVARFGFRTYYESQRRLNLQAEVEGPVSKRAWMLNISLGPTLRLAVLLASGSAAAWRPEAIWIYPAYSLVLGNLLFVWVRFEARRPAPAVE